MRALLAVLLLVSLAGCRGTPTPAPMTGTTWNLVSVAGVTPAADRVPTLKIEKGVASGTTGCNSYSAPVIITGDAITVGQGSLGETACPNAAADEIETRFVKALAAAQHIDVVNGQLLISGASGDLVFNPGR